MTDIPQPSVGTPSKEWADKILGGQQPAVSTTTNSTGLAPPSSIPTTRETTTVGAGADTTSTTTHLPGAYPETPGSETPTVPGTSEPVTGHKFAEDHIGHDVNQVLESTAHTAAAYLPTSVVNTVSDYWFGHSKSGKIGNISLLFLSDGNR